MKDRAAGRLLAEITVSDCHHGALLPEDHRQSAGLLGALSLLAVMNRRCHLPAPIGPACCQPQEHFVF